MLVSFLDVQEVSLSLFLKERLKRVLASLETLLRCLGERFLADEWLLHADVADCTHESTSQRFPEVLVIVPEMELNAVPAVLPLYPDADYRVLA